MNREDVIRMARDAGAPDWWIGLGVNGEASGPALLWLEAICAQAVAAEREACSQIAEEWLGPVRDRELHIASAIRARGQAA